MRRGFAFLVPLLVSAFALPACQREATPPSAKPPEPGESARPRPIAVRDEIPPGEVEAVMMDHFRGLGHMERYEYDQAAEAFAKVHERAPGWIPGSINLALALLNQTGNEAEKDKGAGGGAPKKPRFDQALELLGDVLTRDPNNLHAHFARAIILQYQGEIARAHDDFAFVAEHDPSDGHAWYGAGSTLADPTNSETVKRQIEIFTRALECNPYLTPALYNLQLLKGRAGDRAGQKALLDLWLRLNPERDATGTGETAAKFYGEMGRYATVINPFPASRVVEIPGLAPRFDPPFPLKITLAEGDRWVKAEDFTGPLAVIGRVRARFGAAAAVFDANGDDRLDLYLASAVKGPKGVRDALLINKGEGAFEDATMRLGLPADRASLGVAAGDFDADRRIDLFLTGVGGNRLYHRAEKGFEDVTEKAGIKASAALSLSARWLDLDQDGDLDLYVINYTDRDHADAALTDQPTPGLPNAAYRNDGKPAPISGRPPDNWAPPAVAPEDLPATAGLSIALTPWPDAEALLGGTGNHTALAALDLDDDRDLDLVVSSDGGPPVAILNDRLGRFHTGTIQGLDASSPISGLLVTDFDKDGRADLVATRAGGRVFAWRNTTDRSASRKEIVGESWPIDASDWSSAVAADLDLDTWTDLVGLASSAKEPTLAWARNEGTKFATRPLALGPDESAEAKPSGFVYADLAGDALPDLLLVGEGVAPRLALNRGNGRHWLALDLTGQWKIGHDRMRTNPHGLGVRLALQGQGLSVPYDHTTPEAGLAQSVAPIVLGMGTVPSAALLRLRWPDGTMQSELNVPANQALTLIEHNRKSGSCPVLFSWNGERFVCLGDFLGGGGLGYLVAPGVYSQPDRDEALAIAPDQLRAEGDDFRLAIVEPMDELAYLDHLTLDVVDTPPGVSATPDERFAPDGPRPTGALVAWRTAVEPVRACDLAGRDVTELLRAWDRRTVDRFRRLAGWIGYAEEHGIVLDFGDRLCGFGPGDSLVLCLAGWVEYPYSQTNYAAATAGETLRPPIVERRRDDGTWEVIEPHAGYPAGLPRMTTLDLTGKLTGPRCTLRLRTNMECYWDQAFVAVRTTNASIRVTTLPVARAMLGYRGYCREVSPDGRLPLLYDYDQVDPAPLARMAGRLTRFGDVAELLQGDDDRLCLVGPGDEVRLAFDARRAPALPDGWSRRFVLRSTGYCKDADPCTATSDSVEPLPWRAMPEFPFGIDVIRSESSSYLEYIRTYQTRLSGAP
jgi:tetratricopeptide (TPR) repeat protein